jgi:hypothetical protein
MSDKFGEEYCGEVLGIREAILKKFKNVYEQKKNKFEQK